MMKARFDRFTTAVVLGLAAGTLTACGGHTDAKPAEREPAKPMPVGVAVATMLPAQRRVHIIGELAPLERMTVSNRVVGTISEIHFDAGDEVRPSEGDKRTPMLVIEPSRFRIAIRQARQQLNEVLAKLGRPERLGDKDVVDEQHPVLNWSQIRPEDTAPYKRAESMLETAQKKYDRAKPLYDQKLIRDIEFTNYENDVAVAQSNLRVAADEARALVAMGQGLEANIQMRQKDLDESTIYAPGNTVPDAERTKIKRWWVTERSVSPGEYVKEGTALFTLEADEPIKLHARVPERELSRVAVGNKVIFQVEAYGDRDFAGEIRVIDSAVDPANRTFRVEARVENPIEPRGGGKPQRLLRTGQFVQGDINVGGNIDKVLCVPVSSVTSFVGENKVFAIVPPAEAGTTATVRQVPVVLGQRVEHKGADGKAQDWVEISFKDPKSTLKPGDRIVLAATNKLVDKSPVEVQDGSPAGALEK